MYELKAELSIVQPKFYAFLFLNSALDESTHVSICVCVFIQI